MQLDLVGGLDRYLAVDERGCRYGFTYDQATSGGTFDFAAQTFVPLVRNPDKAARLARHVLEQFPVLERDFGQMSPLVEVVEAFLVDRPGMPESEVFHVACVRVAKTPQTMCETPQDFGVDEYSEEVSILPRGIVVTDYEGKATGISFTGPNWLNDSFGNGITWVKSLDPLIEDFEFKMPDFPKDGA